MNTQNNDVILKIYDNSSNTLIERKLHELIPEVVAAQIDIDIEYEFIKVQAILARTQILRLSRLFDGKGCSKHIEADLCLDGHCLDWKSKEEIKDLWGNKFENRWNKILKATEETEFLIISYNNKIIDPKYHLTCGGSTNNSESVYKNKVVYLRKVLCNHCEDSPYYCRSVDYKLGDMQEAIGVKFNPLTSTDSFEITDILNEVDREDDGRIRTIKVGETTMTGVEFCNKLGIDSTRFGFRPSIINFEVRGSGHGVGLCLYGGNKLAAEGNSYKDIIKYYYTGVDIKRYEKPDKDNPLNGKSLILDPGHGGIENPGHTTNSGVMEKDITLNVSKLLKEKLESLGAVVKLTREDDVYVPLSRRASISSQERPQFFISIHMNSFGNSNFSGVEGFHYRGDKDSRILSEFIIKRLQSDTGCISRGVKEADYYLLKTVTTSVLHLELDYLSNDSVVENYQDQDYINMVVESMAQGIVDYYKYQI